MIKSHKDLDVWKKSIELVTVTYELTNSFPVEEIYGITNQIRRAAVSIPSNIAEGAGRGTNAEFIRFLNIAQGSLAELETQFIISRNLQFLIPEEIFNNLDEIRKMIWGLINYLKNKS